MGQAVFVFNLEVAPGAPSFLARPVSSSVCTQAQMVDTIPGPEAHAPPSWRMDLWLLAKSENSQIGLFCEWSSMGFSHIHGLPAIPSCLIATVVRLCLVIQKLLLLLDSHSWLSEDWRAGTRSWTIPFSPHKELTAALFCRFQTKMLFPKAQSSDVWQSRVPFLGLGLQRIQEWPFKHTQVLLNKMCFLFHLQLQSIIKKVIAHFHDFSVLFSMVSNIP